jgi:hypothetical protein
MGAYLQPHATRAVSPRTGITSRFRHKAPPRTDATHSLFISSRVRMAMSEMGDGLSRALAVADYQGFGFMASGIPIAVRQSLVFGGWLHRVMRPVRPTSSGLPPACWEHWPPSIPRERHGAVQGSANGIRSGVPADRLPAADVDIVTYARQLARDGQAEQNVFDRLLSAQDLLWLMELALRIAWR